MLIMFLSRRLLQADKIDIVGNGSITINWLSKHVNLSLTVVKLNAWSPTRRYRGPNIFILGLWVVRSSATPLNPVTSYPHPMGPQYV